MQLISLPDKDKINLSEVPRYSDHYLFLKEVTEGFAYPEHYTGLGVVCLLNGKAKLIVNDERISLDPAGFLIVNRGSRLSFKLEKTGGRVTILFFDDQLSRLLSHELFGSNINFAEVDVQDYSLIEHVHFTNSTLKEHFELLVQLGQSCASFHSLKADLVVRSILEQLISENHKAIVTASKLEVVKKTTRVSLYKKITFAKLWIEQNYARPINLDDAAAVAMLNKEHFLRLFKKLFLITPHQYLTNFRLEKAKYFLDTTSLPILEICQDVGFESVSTFSNLFKNRTGLTPGKYRNR